MRGLIEWSVEHPLAISVLFVALLISGVYSFFRLRIDLLPDVSVPSITVIVPFPGADPLSVEKMITEPVEGNLKGISGVQRVVSRSSEGYSQIRVDLSYGKDLNTAFVEISERVRQVKLPEGAGPPSVIPFDPSVFPVITFTFPEDQGELLRLYWEDVVLSLKDVAFAPLLFTYERYLRISLRPEKLAFEGVRPSHVVGALLDRSKNIPARGSVLQGKPETPSALMDLMVGFKGRPVFLYEVADLEDFVERFDVLQLNNDTPAVINPVFKVSGANTYEVGKRLKEAIEEVSKRTGIRYWIAMDQSFLIEKVIREVGNSAVIGGILAVFFIILFLRSFRLAISIGMIIPPAIVISVMVLHFLGYTLNAMTMAGFALAIGMILDNSVVVSENIYRLKEAGLGSKEAAVEGTHQVIGPITAATITTVIVFFPVVYLKGPVGKIAENVAVAVISALASTLFLATTITPSYVRFIVGVGKGFGGLALFYGKLLKVYLKRRFLPSLLSLFLLTPIALTPFVGGEFLPVLDSDFIFLEVVLPPNTPYEKTAHYMRGVSNILRDIPEIENYAVFVSAPENVPKGIIAYGGGATEVYIGQAFIRLKERAKRRRVQREIEEEIAARLPPYPGMEVRFLPVERITLFGKRGRAITVSFTGRDVEVLEEIARKFAEEIRGIEGITNVEVETSPRRPVEVLRIREDVKALGTSVSEVQRDIFVLREGFSVGVFGGREVIVGGDTSYTVETFPVVGDSGVGYLMDYAERDTVLTPAVLNRENGMRTVRVSADRRTPNLWKVFSEVNGVLQRFKLPQGYGYTVGGEVADMVDMLQQVLLAGFLAVVLVYAVLVAQFENLKIPFAIGLSVLYGLAGSVLFMKLSGTTFSLVSALGILVSSGVVVNNGIVMLSMARRLKGKSPLERIVEAASVRIRPILITTTTTLLGLLPMIFMVSEGFEYRRPIAIALFGGLLWGTLYSLFVLPFVYTLIERKHPSQS